MSEHSKGLAVVTGASSGIGALYAEQLARRGHDLVLVARRADRLEALAHGLRAETGRAVEALALDLADPADLARLEARLASDTRIDTLINNAGAGGLGQLAQTDPARLEAMLRLNVVALTRLTRAVLPGLVARGHGAIVNVASILAFLPQPGNAAYSGSKAYVLNFSEGVQQEVAASGVLVQALLPGATATDFWGTAGVDLSKLPASIVMSGADLVAAALRGLDRREEVCIPGLPEIATWEAFRAERAGLGQAAMSDKPAARLVA